MICPSRSPSTQVPCLERGDHVLHRSRRADGTEVTWTGTYPSGSVPAIYRAADPLPAHEDHA